MTDLFIMQVVVKCLSKVEIYSCSSYINQTGLVCSEFGFRRSMYDGVLSSIVC